jgi:ribonuclease HII
MGADSVRAMQFAGIDEAGYGPTLGPLCVVKVQARATDEATLRAAFARADTGVRDSKQVHRSGDIMPLEALCLPALAWLTGSLPDTAAAVFALLGEHAEARTQAPWMAGAEALAVPVAGNAGTPWQLEGIEPGGLSGHILHPRAYTQSLRSGLNKADLELGLVRTLLALVPASDDSATVVDRLGGRRYYRDLLQSAWPDDLVLVEAEDALASRYVATRAGREHRVAFLVGGESHSPLTALASCLAKYARELHVHLLNAWFRARIPGLRPTAGYPEDAARWLQDIDGDDRRRYDDVLVRTERARPARTAAQG